MPVKAYITRDPSGNPWPPVHEHEATAVIGLIQRLHEALNHERAFYAVFADLMKFGNQNRQPWNRGFSRLLPPEGSTPASYYRI